MPPSLLLAENATTLPSITGNSLRATAGRLPAIANHEHKGHGQQGQRVGKTERRMNPEKDRQEPKDQPRRKAQGRKECGDDNNTSDNTNDNVEQAGI
jgi:hypothetical protein